MGIYFKRQGGLIENSDAPVAPTGLKYGEPAIDSNGNLYIGDGVGGVVCVAPVLYMGTFTADGWGTDNGAYTQTQAVTHVKGGMIPMAEGMMLDNPRTAQADSQATSEAKQEALGMIAAGKCTAGNGTVTVKCWEKPTIDLDVYWDAR